MADPRQDAAEFAASLKSRFPQHIEKVILYGSAARGEHDTTSDIDMIIVARDRKLIDRELSRMIGAWMAKTGWVLEPFELTPDEFNTLRGKRSAFARAIRDEGIVLAG